MEADHWIEDNLHRKTTSYERQPFKEDTFDGRQHLIIYKRTLDLGPPSQEVDI